MPILIITFWIAANGQGAVVVVVLDSKSNAGLWGGRSNRDLKDRATTKLDNWSANNLTNRCFL